MDELIKSKTNHNIWNWVDAHVDKFVGTIKKRKKKTHNVHWNNLGLTKITKNTKMAWTKMMAPIEMFEQNLTIGTCLIKVCPVIGITGVFKLVISQSAYLKGEK